MKEYMKLPTQRPDLIETSCFNKSRLRLFALMLACLASMTLMAEKGVTIPEQIEWTWEVRPPQPDPKLPNVLLLGDSISRNYFPEVQKDLNGIANVYLMASSTSIGDPRLEHQIAEFAAAENVRFRVVHFNNGMHGWAYTEAQYKADFPAFLRALRSLAGKGGALIWASTTPVRSDANNGATNPRVQERNRIAGEFVQAAGIQTDDQFSLMEKHQDLYQDSVHFNSAGADIQGDHAAEMIRMSLGLPQR
jgi:lysophospholipase L1-like esterase